jgi:hypothetical protein
MQAIVKNEVGRVRITATAAVAPGDIVSLPDGRVGVFTGSQTCAIGDIIELVTEGEIDVTALTGTTFSQGSEIYWDASASTAVATSTGVDDFYIGRAVAAKVSGELVVSVAMVEGFAGRNPVVRHTRGITLDHADATEHDVIAAEDNVNGSHVLFFGTVTEQPVGSSEDQLILGLFDEDDNELARITTTNTTPDAVGVQLRATTGKQLPAGKGAYVKVVQATAGGSPAGAVRVWVHFGRY